MDSLYPPINKNRDNEYFPLHTINDGSDLVAIGGQLTVDLILSFYSQGIFPWYNNDVLPILWYNPDPRFVLFPKNLHISRKLKSLFQKPPLWSLKLDYAFSDVIRLCASRPRTDQSGTWITPNMQKVYIELHRIGLAHSCEVYKDTTLIGGFYGVCLGKIFFGESMISLEPQVSKYAFIKFVQYFTEKGLKLIDCQQKTQHLLSMGATYVTRKQFLNNIKQWISPDIWQGNWGAKFCDFC